LNTEYALKSKNYEENLQHFYTVYVPFIEL